MDLKTFLGILLRSWWLILLSIITTAGSAAFVVRGQQELYRAETTVELRANAQLDDAQLISAINVLDKRTIINTQARKATGTAMRDKVASGLNLPPEVVADSNITAVVVPQSNLIEIRATRPEPDIAAAISNKVAEELRNELPDKVMTIDIIDRAVPPTEPIEPQPARTITLGVLFGGALGVVFALLGHMLQVYRGQERRREAEQSDGAVPDGLNPAKTQQLFTR